MRLVLIVLCAILTSAAAPQTGSPDRADLALAHARAFVAALNTGTPQAARDYAANHSSAGPDSADRFLALARRELDGAGAIESPTYEVRPSGTHLFITGRRAATGAWQTFQFQIAPEGDARLGLIFIAEALAPIALPALNIGRTGFETWLDGAVSRMGEEQPFSGVIVVMRDGAPAYRKAFGKANDLFGVPNTLDTRFTMASGAKMFTAAATMRLIEDGKLSLDDTVAQHVRELAGRPEASRITVRMLLSHTSGIPDFWDQTYADVRNQVRTPDQLLAHVIRRFGAPAPGGAYQYSNSNFALLGVIIERVAGESFYDVVDREVFRRAGMTRTDYPIGGEGARDAVGYNPVYDAGRVSLDRREIVAAGEVGGRGRASAAGGASTTVDDVLAFETAMRSGRVVRPETFAAMTALQSRAEDVPDYGYGYGYEVDARPGFTSWGHGGSAPGAQMRYRHFPSLGITYVILSNFNTIAPDELAKLLDRLAQREMAASGG